VVQTVPAQVDLARGAHVEFKIKFKVTPPEVGSCAISVTVHSPQLDQTVSRQVWMNSYWALIQHAEREIERAGAQGYVVVKASQLLELARRAYEERQFDQVKQLVDRALQSIGKFRVGAAIKLERGRPHMAFYLLALGSLGAAVWLRRRKRWLALALLAAGGFLSLALWLTPTYTFTLQSDEELLLAIAGSDRLWIAHEEHDARDVELRVLYSLDGVDWVLCKDLRESEIKIEEVCELPQQNAWVKISAIDLDGAGREQIWLEMRLAGENPL
jgi:hypothetical protein